LYEIVHEDSLHAAASTYTTPGFSLHKRSELIVSAVTERWPQGAAVHEEVSVALGPIEVLVLGFPENEFTGGILPEIERLVDADTISIIDAMLIIKDADGDVEFVEIEQLDENHDAAALKQFVGQSIDLLSDEDAEGFSEALAPGSSAAVLVFEHTWFKPLRDELIDSGGILIANMRIPGLVVEEVIAAVAELEEQE
jgi:hypothetical protein